MARSNPRLSIVKVLNILGDETTVRGTYPCFLHFPFPLGGELFMFPEGDPIGWTGIGTYLRNLLSRFPSLDSTAQFTVITNPSEKQTLPSGIQSAEMKWYAPVYSLREQLMLPSQFREADIVHFPHFTVPLAFRRAYVVTLHDLVYFLFRNACPHRVGYWYARAMYPAVARRARLVITDSFFSSDEILRSLPIQKERIRVIYPGVDTEHFQPQSPEAIGVVLQKYGITRQYLLYVGNHQPRKNILRLMEAFAHMGQRRNYQLVIGGPRDPRRVELEDGIHRLGLQSEVILTDLIPLEDLPALYSGASCFVFPSLYEGFGFPVLESMACGTPVVTSDRASLPEVVGDAGILVDPNDPQSLRVTIERVIESRTLQEELRERGMVRARQFSWETTAKQTLDVYYEALSTSPVAR
ncbi:glycosyltransferase family 4 protein [Patescibacteria group bacterium]|nr:glycosyltransferase family 4 protein [Patescibacteria group bacterium]